MNFLLRTMAAAAVLLSAAPALADSATGALVNISAPACAPGSGEKIKAAQELLDLVMANFQARGFPAIVERRSEIQAALDAAPAPLSAEICDGELVVRSDQMGDFLLMSAAAQSMKPEQQPASVVWRPYPYPNLALSLGSSYVEENDYVHAAPALLRGLDFAPNNPMLATEAALALTGVGRSADALALVDRVLDGAHGLEPRDQARLLRTRGFVLGEAGRFDEAMKAYKQSLKLEPGNHTALNELEYLKQRKKGAPRQDLVNTTINDPNGTDPNR